MGRACTPSHPSVCRLRSAGLRVKERKCSFAKNKWAYLGYVVGGGTIEPMECKVLAVQTFAQPRTKKQVKTYLGLCGYYRKFKPEFSTVASPLLDLTKKNMSKSVKWTSQCEKAFGQLTQALTKGPVLITPGWDKPFTLQTDASATGLGYVLSQINADGEEHSIAFGSKKLLPREINYSAIEREALAIVKGIQHFRTYLEGISFKIETDHNPLTHLSKTAKED